MKLTVESFRKMIDFTLLHNTDSDTDILDFARKTREGDYACAYVMPCYSALMARELQGTKTVAGGAVAFPTGSEPLEIKVAMTKYHIGVGCGEIDYVINVNKLKSGDYDYLADEARQIVAAAQGRPVKAIIEVALLTDEEIKAVCECLLDTGITFIKTGTGTQKQPTTVHHIELISSVARGKCQIKAAGGIRTLDTVIAMIKLGVTRFGISWNSAYAILDELEQRYPNGVEI